MGVPAFYKWLVGKYPKVVVDAVEESDCVDSSEPNPNRIEFDNLYLDMNGIVHPCFHPEDQSNGPTNFEEVFSLIYEYIDGIFKIVRPRKLLYMAIDGVAPRAKMNQQRTRRFKTARDAELAEAEEARLREEFERSGKEVLPKEESELSDSNIITPGTVFMQKLATALEGYIRNRINNVPGWKSIKVILSDSSVPGEGEHKIMSFIRSQRSSSGYNPQTTHCLYGLDADLIMLALATHEVNFFVLREKDILKNGHDNALSEVCATFSKTEIGSLKSRQWFLEEFHINREKTSVINRKKPYEFLNIWTLREYLEMDMCSENEVESSDAKFKIDVERIVDDFIFMCFFTGNDFLPHMPSLDIHEGALDLLMHVYKKNIITNGYLIDTSRIHEKKAAFMKIKRVEKFILEVGTYEEKIFKKRYGLKQANMRWFLNQLERDQKECDEIDQTEDKEHIVLYSDDRKKDISASSSISAVAEKEKISDVIANTDELKQKLKNVIRNNSDLYKNGIFDKDKVNLGIDGWKFRYYKEKFSAGDQIEAEIKRKEIVEKYMEGLCWMLHYYFSDVCSWSWYYPFYYAPFASDLKRLSCPSSAFKIGEPFKPYNQLMAVLPPRSSNALPKAYMNLMKSEDSPLMEFYPKVFEVDANGKRFTWQAVCKLPFIDEDKLLAATKNVENDLEFEEVVRNSIGNDRIFVRDSDGLGVKIASVQPQIMFAVDINSCGLNGNISLSSTTCTATNEGVEHEDHTVSADFFNPDQCSFVPRMIVLEDSQLPKRNVKREDIVERKLWHQHEKPHHPVITNYSRYITRNMDLPKQSGPNDHARHSGGDSGWGSRGRGRTNNDASSSGILPNERSGANGPNWRPDSSGLGRGRYGSGPNDHARRLGGGLGWGGRGRGGINNDAFSSGILPNEHSGANGPNWRPDSSGLGSGRYGSGPNDHARRLGGGSGWGGRGRERINNDAFSSGILPNAHSGANGPNWRPNSSGQERGRYGSSGRYNNSTYSSNRYGSRRDGGGN